MGPRRWCPMCGEGVGPATLRGVWWTVASRRLVFCVFFKEKENYPELTTRACLFIYVLFFVESIDAPHSQIEIEAGARCVTMFRYIYL